MMIGKTNATMGGAEIMKYDPSLSTADLTGNATPTSSTVGITIGSKSYPSKSTSKIMIPNNVGLSIEIENPNMNFNYVGGYTTPYFTQVSDSISVNSVVESLKANGLKLPDGKFKICIYASDIPQPQTLKVTGTDYGFFIKVENGVWGIMSGSESGASNTIMTASSTLLSSAYLIPYFITKFER